MSLIVAVKHKDRFIIGADKQCSTGTNKDHSATKIWEDRDLPGVVMGGVGSVRATQIVQYSNIIDLNCLPHGITTEYITRSLVPEIITTLEQNGIQCIVSPDDKTRVLPNVFLFAYEDKAWVIWNDLSVIEIEDYFAIGSGADVARGALYATADKNPFERIVTCIDAAAETTLFVDNGVDILATEYFEKDEALIKKALGLSDDTLDKSSIKAVPAANTKKEKIKKSKIKSK